MHVGTHKYGILAGDILIEQGIKESVSLFLMNIQMVHAVLLTSYLGLIMHESERMCRHINLRNHINAIFHTHTLKFGKLFLSVRAVFSRKSGETFAFQAESSVSAVPVVIEELRESVIVKVNLKLIHLIERKYFNVLLQIVHRKELTSHIEHESAVRKRREVAHLALRQLTFLII